MEFGIGVQRALDDAESRGIGTAKRHCRLPVSHGHRGLMPMDSRGQEQMNGLFQIL